jgi:PAS domain S-box-containing protein
LYKNNKIFNSRKKLSFTQTSHSLHLNDSTKIILNAFSSGICIANKKGIISFANESFKNLFSAEHIDFKKKINIFDFNIFKRKNIIDKLNSLLKNDKSFDIKTITLNISKNNNIFARLRGYHLNNEHNKINEYLIQISDITERKRAEIELAFKEQQYRKIFEDTPIGKYRTTPGGRIVVANSFLMKMLGYNNFKEFSKLNLNEFELSNFSRKQFIKLMEKKKKVNGIESMWRKKDGTRFWVRENSVAIKNSKGKTIYYDSTIEDISARKKAEEELKNKSNILQIVMDTIQTPIYYKNIDGNYLGCNSAFEKEVGLPRKKIIGKKVVDIAPSDFIGKYLEKDSEIIEKGGPQSFKYKIKTRDNKISNVFFNKNLFYNSDGSKGGIVGIYFDISQLEKSEMQIRDTEKKYRDLFENANDSILIFEPENETILDVNSKACEVFGYEYKELIGKSLKKFTKDIKKGEDTIKYVLKNGSIKNYETTYLRKDGSYISMYANISTININEKRYMLCINTDITELKNTVRALNDSESKFRTVFESANDGIFILKDYKFTDCNSKCIELFGRKKEDLIGKFPYESKLSPKYQLDGIKSDIKAKRYLDLALKGKSFFFEWRHKKIDRSMFDNEINLSRFKIGNDYYIQAILRDISSRKQAEAEILKLSRAVKQSTASIMITDTKGNIEYVNPKFCETTGYLPEEVLGKKADILKSEKINSDYHKNLWEIIKVGKEWTGEFYNKKKNGEYYWSSYLISPIKNEKGIIVNYLAISDDITEKKIKDEQLKNSLKEIEVMLKEIHHRVKNNLQVILSLLKLQSESITDKKTLEYFKVNEDRIRSMAMIHELLYGSKNFSKINFFDYVTDLTSYLSDTYSLRKDFVTTKLNIKDVYLSIDTAVPCGLLINELLTNAFKHAFKDKKKGKIEIFMNNINKNDIELIIKDDGIGLPGNININETKTLGMQLVNALIEQLNGKLILDTIAGTEFKIIFPQNVYIKKKLEDSNRF